MKIRILFYAIAIAAACFVGLSPMPAQAQVGVSINVGTPPPPLPVYDQPDIPGPDYIWTPGYWAWDSNVQDYYWVPGTWVLAPQIGFLWTPAWWGWSNNAYCFHSGYWGPHVGFYGGVCYGHGYFGNGYEGGRWNNGHFYYNRNVNNIRNARVTNVYNKNVDIRHSNVSYNGGRGGLTARPTADQQRVDRESHIGATAAQNHHIQTAAADRNLRYSANHGRPDLAATPRAGEFNRTANANAQGNHTAQAAAINHTDKINPAEAKRQHDAAVNNNVVKSNQGLPQNQHQAERTASVHQPTPQVQHQATASMHQEAQVHHPASAPQVQRHATASVHQAAPQVHHSPAPQVHAMSHPGGGGHPGGAPHPSAGGGHPAGGGGGHPSGGQHH